MIIFAAGVGVSLYAGQIETWLERGKRVEISWTDRDFKSLMFLTEELSRAYPTWRAEENLSARVFCTSAMPSVVFSAASSMMDCFQAEHSFNPITGLPVHFRRPNFDFEFRRFELKYPQQNFAVFCCGPQPFTNEIENAVQEANARRIAQYSFSPEIFQFSWLDK